MPLKELLVVVCLIITAQAVAFSCSQLYLVYLTSGSDGMSNHYLDEYGIIRFGTPPSRYSGVVVPYAQVYVPVREDNAEEW